jgi:hypothetical protein
MKATHKAKYLCIDATALTNYTREIRGEKIRGEKNPIRLVNR